MIEDKKIGYSLSELDVQVGELMHLLPTCKVITFSGQLGAGKSTLVRSLLRACGIQGVIASPTFTYVNVYQNDKGEHFYHFDLYRIASLDEFINAGFNEYLYQPQSWCFIEWPEIIMPLLTHNVAHVSLEYVDAITRQITIKTGA